MTNPIPQWYPTPDFIKTTNIAQTMTELGFDNYSIFHAWSVTNYADYWAYVIKKLNIIFDQSYSKIVDLSHGVESPRWLPDAKLNIANSCFQAPKDQIAIIYQPENGPLQTLSYKALNNLSNQVANGVKKYFQLGDAIGICMPMTPECVAIYLGIIKAGCSVVSIADSFSAEEIATRLRIANAKGIFTQDYILRGNKRLPLYDRVKNTNVAKIIVVPVEDNLTDTSRNTKIDTRSPYEAQRNTGNFLKNSISKDALTETLRSQDIGWQNFLSSEQTFSARSCKPQDHINILFSSGTTGDPKAIPWNHTTAIKAAADAFFHHDVHPQDIIAWPTNIGWMMGPWLIFASLLNRSTMALYGGSPLGKEFGEFVQNAKVNILGVVPSIVKTWRNSSCMEGLDWSAIKCFTSTGECSNSDDMQYLMQLADNKPVIEYCGGTEIGGGFITGTLVQPAAPAAFTTPALGIDFVILDEQGNFTNNGEIALIPPSMGLSTELLNKDHHQTYYADMPKTPDGKILRRHGDQIEKFANGFYRIQGRVDDTMNLGAIKISSAEIERALVGTPNVLETAAIAINPPGGGPSQLVIYAVPNTNSDINTTELKTIMQAAINKNLNPLFKIHEVVLIEALPRTVSNKVMRRVLREKY